MLTLYLLAVILLTPHFGSAQTLLDTGAAMSVGTQMQSGTAGETPKQGGRVGAIGQANAERNAQIEAESGAVQNTPMDDSGAAPPPAGANSDKDAQIKKILETGWWGPGNYFDPIKLSIFITIFVLWVFSAGWINEDMERLKIANRESFNIGYLAAYGGVAGGLFFVPIFWVVFPVTFLVWLVPLLVYVVHRNKKVPAHEQVLTPEHIFFCIAILLNKIGVKVKVKKRQVYQVGPPIDFVAIGQGLDAKTLQGRLILARNTPGYNLLRQHIYDAILCNATALMFDFTPERTTIRHQVDGVWFDLPPIPRTIEKGKTKDNLEEMLESAKMLIGGNPADRRGKQIGSCMAQLPKKVKYEVGFTSQGTPTGEAALIQFTAQKVPFKSLDALGLSLAMQQKLIAQLNAKSGIFVVAAPPANGLRSSMDLFSRNCDRFTRDVVNVEDIMAPSEPIENVIQGIYDSSKKETPMKVLPDILFKEPHCVIVRDMSNLEVLQLCCDEVDRGRLFITMTRAKDASEVIMKFLSLKIPPQQFVSKLNGVISQRLIRKLCPDCKEPYSPPPQLLQQLGLRPDQVEAFYRTRTPLPEPEERKRGTCPTCNGIGYRGRTAIFEIIVLDNTIREQILSTQNLAGIRQCFAKSGQKGFQHEGIALLLKGETTVEELQRVLK
ncbi:MAG: ATPase, T2SS/T4P/T4SS family [Thermoguttaceae bacterium]